MLGQNIQFSSQRCLQCSEYFCFQERKTNQKKMLKFVSKFVTSKFSVLTTFSDLLFPSEKLSSAPQLLGRANMRLSQLHNKTKQTMWLGLKNKKLRSPISHSQMIKSKLSRLNLRFMRLTYFFEGGEERGLMLVIQCNGLFQCVGSWLWPETHNF